MTRCEDRAALGKVRNCTGLAGGKVLVELVIEPGFELYSGQEIAVARLEPPPIYGQLAKKLFQSGVLMLPAVAAALGSDRQYQEWTRLQPCIVTRQMPVEYAHVRRAHNSGVGYKPMFSGVPLASEVHRLQHQNGELACLQHHGKRVSSVHEAKAWFDKASAHNLRLWAWERLREAIGVGSMRDANPVRVMAWFTQNGLENAVPRAYREAVKELSGQAVV